MATRLFDIAMAIIGLIFLFLLFPIVAFLIKLDSRGPVFFKCARVGKDGKIFHMYKFRTMFESDIKLGHSVSPQRDPRVTPVGRVLRRLKLNEFPQFLNILRGEMTLVGPRPEAPDLAADYPLEAQKIFQVKPGLVGPNQILGRNEEEFYPPGVNPREYYLAKILPRKIPLDLDYIEQKSFLLDVKYLFLGLWVTITGLVSAQHLSANKPRLLMVTADSAFCLISFMLAYLIRYETLTLKITGAHLQILPFAALTNIPFLFLLGCYNGVIDFFGINDIKNIFKGLILGTLTLILISLFFKYPINYGASIFFINFFVLSVLLIGYRILLTTLEHFFRKDNGLKTQRVLIIGAGEEGLLCHHYLKKSQDFNYQIMGFIDEDSRLQYKNINGTRVMGSLADLEILLPLYKIDEVFITDSIKEPEQGIKLQHLCRKNFVTLTSFVPNMAITRPFVYPQKTAPSIS